MPRESWIDKNVKTTAEMISRCPTFWEICGISPDDPVAWEKARSHTKEGNIQHFNAETDAYDPALENSLKLTPRKRKTRADWIVPVELGRLWIREKNSGEFRVAHRPYNKKHVEDGNYALPYWGTGNNAGAVLRVNQSLSGFTHTNQVVLGSIGSGSPSTTDWDRTFDCMAQFNPELQEPVRDVDIHYRPLRVSASNPDAEPVKTEFFDQTLALVTESGLKLYTLNGIDEDPVPGNIYRDLDMKGNVPLIRLERYHLEPDVEEAADIAGVRCCRYNAMFPLLARSGSTGQNGIFSLTADGRLIRYGLTSEIGRGYKMPKIVRLLANNEPARLEYGCFERCNDRNAFPELEEEIAPYRVVTPLATWPAFRSVAGSSFGDNVDNYVRCCVPEQPLKRMVLRYGLLSADEMKWSFIDWRDANDPAETALEKWGSFVFADNEMIYFGTAEYQGPNRYLVTVTGKMPIRQPKGYQTVSEAHYLQKGAEELYPNYKRWPNEIPGDLQFGTGTFANGYHPYSQVKTVTIRRRESNGAWAGVKTINMLPGTPGDATAVAVAYFNNGDALYI